MRSLRSALVLLGLAAITAVSARARAGADDAFEPLRRDFGHLHQSLVNSRGILDEDRPAVEAFLDRVEAFERGQPDHAGAVAMVLQLALWLDDDDRARDAFARLMELRPDDVALAEAWLGYLERSGVDDEALGAAGERLRERFPDEPRFLRRWAEARKGRALYGEVIEGLRSSEAAVADDPELQFLLADCLFAEHQFEEALAALNAIPTTGAPPRVRSEVDRLRPYFEQYVELWPAEQEIRAAEAAADDLPRVEIATSRGRVLVELFEDEAPNTVANFIALSESGFYAGTRFHRYEPDFMIQGGDPNSREGAEGTPGTGDPGYRIPDEHAGDVYRRHFNDSIAMAKTADPDTGGCQFYLTLRPTGWLNGKHTVFGRVIDGLDVVRSLRKDDEITAVTVVRKRDHEYRPETLELQ